MSSRRQIVRTQMKGNCMTVPSLLMDEIKRINGNATTKAVGATKRLNVASLNTHLICVLCSGYYVEATAIVECLHTFCRSCIVKYLQSNSFCPICDVQIHKSKPWSSLRPDKTLQDLVYKLVPGLYQNEMRRRRQFYTQLGRKPEMESGEEGGFPSQGARFFAQDDSISLSLEYYNGIGGNEENDVEAVVKAKQVNEKPKRYLQCPAAVTVRHLKKFLRMKYGIGLDCWVDIIYSDECLPDDFTLIDVAYTFKWKRTSPMRFSYRIYSKTLVRAMKTQRNFQIPRLDEEDKKKSNKRQSSLEQQKQNEYLGNFNLNPTNSTIYRNQNHNKNKSHASYNNNNNHHSVKNNNTVSEKKAAAKRDEYIFKDSLDSEDGSRDKMFGSSEDSNASALQIISEKEEDSDSLESIPLGGLIRRKCMGSLANFGEEALDSFSARKLLRGKHKAEGKKEKRKFDDRHEEKEKRRKSEGFEDLRKGSEAKRRKSMADEYSIKRDGGVGFTLKKEDDSIGNHKNEALRKVFVAKDKPEIVEFCSKKKDGEFKRKKRKKSKHHEGETKKRKMEIADSSPSIMSFAKDALKFKFKLTPSKPPEKTVEAEEKAKEEKKKEEKKEVAKEEKSESPEKEVKKTEESDTKQLATDKERLLHLRAVRHKPVANKSSPKDYLNAPPSLTISKIDSSEQSSVKSTLVESRPSLEIMLVSPGDINKPKKGETGKEGGEKEEGGAKAEVSGKDSPSKSEVVDNFGVLDLSEKSTRTKENSSNASSPKEATETAAERCRKTTHQSILQIAQTLVNRKLSPMLPDNPLVRVGDTTVATAAAMRNLKTLSDTAVNILMAAQSKNFANCAGELQKCSFSPISSSPTTVAPALKALPAPNSTNAKKDCENGTGLKIPMYPMARERTNPIPPVPNLHEIYPRGRGRALPLGKPASPAIKPGQNQTVRQIPNPFVVLNRQTNQNQNPGKAVPPQSKTPPQSDHGNLDGTPPKQKTNSIPLLQSIKPKTTTQKVEEKAEVNGSKNGGSADPKLVVSKTLNNNTQTGVKNGSEGNFFSLKASLEKGNLKLNNNTNSIRKIENMAKNIESVAAGLTARAVSNAMIDAK